MARKIKKRKKIMDWLGVKPWTYPNLSGSATTSPPALIVGRHVRTDTTILVCDK